MADRSVRVILTAVTSQYQAAMAKAAATTKAFGASAAKSQATQQTATTAMSRFGLTTGNVMGTLVVGALAGSAKAAMDFESSFAGVRKTVDGSEAELQGLARGLRDMATEIPVNVNELNEIAESAGQLGVSKGAILGFTETIAQLGVTTNLAGEQAASTLARLANITEMPEENFDRLGSTIVALGNAGASTEQEITEFGLRIAGAGHLAGLSEASILAIGNAMSSVGIEAEAGGTAVQKVLLGIDESVVTADDRLATFASTAGMTAAEFQEAWRSDPAAAFTSFVEGLGTAGKGATAILRDLNLTDQRLIRSFLTLAGSGDTLRESIELGNDAWRENNALQEEAAKRFETTENRLQLAKNQINEAGITIGSNLLPVLGDAADAFAAAFPSGGSKWFDQAFDAVGGKTKGLSKEFLDDLSVFELVPIMLERARGPLAALPSGFDAAGSAIAGFGDSQEGAAGATDEATAAVEAEVEALEDLSAALAGASDFLSIESAALDAKNSLLDLKDAQDAVNQLVEDGKKGTREYKRALLGEREAQLGVITSQKDLEESLLSYTEKVKSGEISQRDAIQAVKAFGAAGQLTQGQVESLIERIKGYDSVLEDLPDKKKTRIEADGVDEARQVIDGWMVALDAIPTIKTTTVRVQTLGVGPLGGKPLYHSGGTAGSSTATRYGGLRSNEVPAILQRGEVVFSKAQVKAMASSPGNIIYVDARGSNLSEAQITRAVEKGIDKRNHGDARANRWQSSVAT